MMIWFVAYCFFISYCTHSMPVETQTHSDCKLSYLFIYLLASWESQQVVAVMYKVVSSTVSSIISKACKAVWKYKRTFIELVGEPDERNWKCIPNEHAVQPYTTPTPSYNMLTTQSSSTASQVEMREPTGRR